MSLAKYKYNLASSFFDFFEKPVEISVFKNFRKKAIFYAEGDALEVGVGTGKNIQYYPESINLTAIDFSRGMLKKAEKKIIKMKNKNIKLLEMDVQDMDFDDNLFDTIISTFVFCTVPDPVKGLREIYRVLKPGGKAVFLEHMRSKNLFLNIHLFIMNIFSKIVLGTSTIRKTQENIEKAGFKIIKVQNLLFDVIRLIIVNKE